MWHLKYFNFHRDDFVVSNGNLKPLCVSMTLWSSEAKRVNFESTSHWFVIVAKKSDGHVLCCLVPGLSTVIRQVGK